MDHEVVLVGVDNRDILDRVADEVFDADLRVAALNKFLSHQWSALIVCLKDSVVVGQVRGCVHFQPDDDPELYIDNLGVAPGHHRQGIATALVQALFQWSTQYHCTSYWVATELDNESARAFYQSLDARSDSMTYFEGTPG